ncbi:MAG: hypothetical protein R2991_11510 [Thermoanaerobaculia bacterium]
MDDRPAGTPSHPLDDRVSGAGELEERLRAALARAVAEGRGVEALLDGAEEAVVARFPAMASLVTLVDAARAAWIAGGGAALLSVLDSYGERDVAARIASHLVARGRLPRRILTLSRSGTVLGALAALARRRAGDGAGLPEVLVGEGRPEGEGRTMAADLARAGYETRTVVDAALPALAAGTPAPRRVRLAPDDCWVVLGCDSAGPGGVVNKVGSFPLARAARDAGVPVLVLASSRKLLPADLPLPCEAGPSGGVEPGLLRFDFERVPWADLTCLMLEDAALDAPGALRRIDSLPPIEGPLLRRLIGVDAAT